MARKAQSISSLRMDLPQSGIAEESESPKSNSPKSPKLKLTLDFLKNSPVNNEQNAAALFSTPIKSKFSTSSPFLLSTEKLPPLQQKLKTLQNLGFSDTLKNVILLKQNGESLETAIGILLPTRRNSGFLANFQRNSGTYSNPSSRPSSIASSRPTSIRTTRKNNDVIEGLHSRGFSDMDVIQHALDLVSPCTVDKIIEVFTLHGYKEPICNDSKGPTPKSESELVQIFAELGFTNKDRVKTVLQEFNGSFDLTLNALSQSKYKRISAEKSPRTPISASLGIGFLKFGKKLEDTRFASELEILRNMGYTHEAANFFALDSQNTESVTIERAIEILANFGFEKEASSSPSIGPSTGSVQSADDISIARKSLELLDTKKKKYASELEQLHNEGCFDDGLNIAIIENLKPGTSTISQMVELIKNYKSGYLSKSMPSIAAARPFVSVQTDQFGNNLFSESSTSASLSTKVSNETIESKLERIRSLGFMDRNQCKEALEKCDGNVDAAVSLLLKIRFRKSVVPLQKRYTSAPVLKEPQEVDAKSKECSAPEPLEANAGKTSQGSSAASDLNIFDDYLRSTHSLEKSSLPDKIDYIFYKQLLELDKRGYLNEGLNMQVLDQCHGEIEDAIEILKKYGYRPKIRKRRSDKSSSSDGSSSSISCDVNEASEVETLETSTKFSGFAKLNVWKQSQQRRHSLSNSLKESSEAIDDRHKLRRGLSLMSKSSKNSNDSNKELDIKRVQTVRSDESKLEDSKGTRFFKSLSVIPQNRVV